MASGYNEMIQRKLNVIYFGRKRAMQYFVESRIAFISQLCLSRTNVDRHKQNIW